MTHYKKPEYLAQDHIGDSLDARLYTIIEMLSQAPWEKIDTVLDVGMGQGQLTKWMAQMGKRVTGTGLEMDSYETHYSELRAQYGVHTEQCSVEHMPFPDRSFDAVLMSHVLEHCPNVGLALSEVRRVLKDDGYLMVIVPPHAERVLAGHISVGWNVGQLMYVLLMNGFDVKTGQFAQFGFNVAGFVRKSLEPLPSLRGDRGDIHLLNDHGRFPLPVVTSDGENDNFNGVVNYINWPEPLTGPPAKMAGVKAASRDARHGFMLWFAGVVGAKGRARLHKLAMQIVLTVTDERFRDKSRLS